MKHINKVFYALVAAIGVSALTGCGQAKDNSAPTPSATEDGARSQPISADETPKVDAAETGLAKTASVEGKVEAMLDSGPALTTEPNAEFKQAVNQAVKSAQGKVSNIDADAGVLADATLNNVSDAIGNAAQATTQSAKSAIADVRSELSMEVADETAGEFAALSGDAVKGKRVYSKCVACHAVKEGQNRVGPSLYGVIGRQAGAIESFKYSSANKTADYVWTEEVMFAFLDDPQGYMPGTRMIFAGLPDAQDRADVIAYLKTLTDTQ